MCNFYMMYYTESGKGTDYLECFDDSFPSLSKQMPQGSDVPPPRNPKLEDIAEGHVHHHHMAVVGTSTTPHPDGGEVISPEEEVPVQGRYYDPNIVIRSGDRYTRRDGGGSIGRSSPASRVVEGVVGGSRARPQSFYDRYRSAPVRNDNDYTDNYMYNNAYNNGESPGGGNSNYFDYYVQNQRSRNRRPLPRQQQQQKQREEKLPREKSGVRLGNTRNRFYKPGGADGRGWPQNTRYNANNPGQRRKQHKEDDVNSSGGGSNTLVHSVNTSVSSTQGVSSKSVSSSSVAPGDGNQETGLSSVQNSESSK